MLETYGYHVLTARDGTEAVALYSQHQDKIKGVLTDMLMPDMDGPTTIRILKKLDPGVKIIASSGLMDGNKVKFRLKVLTDDQVEDIHEASLKILEKTGVRFDSEDARKRLLKSGAVKHPTRKDVLTFPRSMVEESIKKIPRYGTYHARDPKNNMKFDGEHVFAHCLGGNPNMLDLETGKARMSTLKDVEETVRVVDALTGTCRARTRR